VGIGVIYKFVIRKKAKKFIDKLPQNEKRIIIDAIEKLPNYGDIKHLKGHEGLLRLRVGKYRIIYSKDDEKFIIYVIDAGNRGEIYRQY
jgi:mRNA interferase RelE/StbE